MYILLNINIHKKRVLCFFFLIQIEARGCEIEYDFRCSMKYFFCFGVERRKSHKGNFTHGLPNWSGNWLSNNKRSIFWIPLFLKKKSERGNNPF